MSPAGHLNVLHLRKLMITQEITNIEGINNLLAKIQVGSPPVICLLTGSSGCGKTYLSENIKEQLDQKKVEVCFFDSIGVPSEEEMIQKYGSGEKWQEAMTHEWLSRISNMTDKALVVFEGQYNPNFAKDACAKLGIEDHALAVVTCSEQVWADRLRGPRSQPELINEDMRNWHQYLRTETEKLGGAVVDTSDSNLSANITDVVRMVAPLLRKRM